MSFAVSTGRADHAVSPEFKGAGHPVFRIAPASYGDDHRPDPSQLLAVFDAIECLTQDGSALALATPGYGGSAEALFKMCVGNQIGFELADDVDIESLFEPMYGSFIVEVEDAAALDALAADSFVIEPLGTTVEGYVLETATEQIDLAELQEAWESGIEGVFPYRTPAEEAKKLDDVEQLTFTCSDTGRIAPIYAGEKFARPRVIIPVFPGNNCEYDSARAFRAAAPRPTSS